MGIGTKLNPEAMRIHRTPARLLCGDGGARRSCERVAQGHGHVAHSRPHAHSVAQPEWQRQRDRRPSAGIGSDDPDVLRLRGQSLDSARLRAGEDQPSARCGVGEEGYGFLPPCGVAADLRPENRSCSDLLRKRRAGHAIRQEPRRKRNCFRFTSGWALRASSTTGNARTRSVSMAWPPVSWMTTDTPSAVSSSAGVPPPAASGARTPAPPSGDRTLA